MFPLKQYPSLAFLLFLLNLFHSHKKKPQVYTCQGEFGGCKLLKEVERSLETVNDITRQVL